MSTWREKFFEVCKPRPHVTGSQWADKFRVIPQGPASEPGQWRTRRTPYLREPMDMATDAESEVVVLMLASQLGKSEMLINVLGYFVDQEPSSILMVQPTIANAEAFSRERIEPSFMASPNLRTKFAPTFDPRTLQTNTRLKGSTILLKQFAGGFLALVGANSPAGLASRPIRVLLCDEIDRYEETKEGDPLELAKQRTANFHNRKIIFVSTPNTAGTSKIEEWYNRSDKRVYKIPCPKCGVCNEWTWGMVKWDKMPDGMPNSDTARIECPDCGEVLRRSGRPLPGLLEAGFWEPTAKSKIKGYHASSLISPWVELSDLVDQFVAAAHSRDKRKLKEFITLRLGEPFDESDLDKDLSDELYHRREFYGEDLPAGVMLITIGVDVQHDRLEATVVGWGIGYECWILLHHKIMGDPFRDGVWQELDQLILQQYEGPQGILSATCVCVDSGDGTLTSRINLYTKTRERNRVFSIKGRGGFDVPFVSKPTRNNRAKCALFVIGVDSGKLIVMQRLALQDAGPGFVHVPRDEDRHCDQRYCRTLASEKLRTKYSEGRLQRRWTKIFDRNEGLDCMVYATAALEILGVNLDTQLKPQIPKVHTQRRRILNKGIDG